MTARAEQFFARDAFIYTDTYRKAIKQSAATLATEKERLRERLRRGAAKDGAYYAELRALEHAINFVVRSEEPKRVVLGEEDGTDTTREEREAQLGTKLAEAQRLLGKEREDKERLKADLRTVGEAYAVLQARAAELTQSVTRLTRRIERTSSTFGVIIFAMSVVIASLMMMVFG
ncbi:MAG: hypothetical protein OQL08_06265 [Gammaproteobacteria bacterium]|nr:hypothetical protein [Gammaproteobacteria bacterium]